MSSQQTIKGVTQTPKPKRNRRKPKSKGGFFNGYTQRIAKFKSVAAAVPYGSTAYIRTVLDPAHMTDYGCTGIPDPNTNATLMYMPRSTIVCPATSGSEFAFEGTWTNATGKCSKRLINHYYIILTEVVSAVVVIGVGTCNHASSVSTWYASVNVYTEPAENISSDETKVRLVSRGMTVSHVGEQMYRGGFFECLSTPGSSAYVDSNNTYKWSANLEKASSCQTFNGTTGVYAVLKPNNDAAYMTWRSKDASAEQLQVLLPETPGFGFGVAITGLTRPDMPAFCPCALKYIPPSVVNVDNGSWNWSLRISYYSAYQYTTTTANSTNMDNTDPAVIQAMFALMQHHVAYYPASYNDLRKILSNVRDFYNKHKKLIDVAAGVIPYGSAVQSGVEALLDAAVGTGGGKRRKRLVRTM